MASSQVRSLPGMIDMTGDSYEQSKRVTRTLGAYFAHRGYGPIDTPIVEDAELFVRKSGGELSGMLYTFDDPGGNRVSLRPEFTSSVIRHYVERSHPLNTPARWYYGGPVFRYHSLGHGGLRQFIQVGAELIGPAGSQADAEVLSIACDALREIGLGRYHIRISDMGLLNRVMDAHGLSPTTKSFVLTHMNDLKGEAGSVDDLVVLASEMGLLRTQEGDETIGQATAEGTGVTRQFLRDLLSDSMSSPAGRRTPEQIVGRLLGKLQRVDQPAKLAAALALVADLSKIQGPVNETLPKAEYLLRAHGGAQAVAVDLAKLFDELTERGIPLSNLSLDLAFVPGIAYYTGVVFEISCDSGNEPIRVGSGGRYDGLVKALGGDENVPAMGFALGLDRILEALSQQVP